jgi:O-6-methylguanine DNA methyltransferase
MNTTSLSTPLWVDLVAIASETHLLMLEFSDSPGLMKKIAKLTTLWKVEKCDNAIIETTREQLREYFAWTRKVFDIPLAPSGTEFQRQAWNALKKIPYGETRSYQEEAILAGNPKAVRAIWGANNKNPIVIIIPCHRVIGKDGSLTGYGGGLDRKVSILAHERRYL